MMLKKVFWALMPCCAPICVYAGTMGDMIANNHYFFSISAGPSWTNAGSTQTIALEPDVINAYVPQNLTNSNVLGNGEFFLGIQKPFFGEVNSQLQMGLVVYVSSFAKLNGYVQVDADSNFQNYSYAYKVDHWHIGLKSKWIPENAYNMSPYISGSVAVGFNNSYDYSSSPLIFQEIPLPPFQSHRDVAFSYSVGAGFQHAINPHFTIGLGYQFVSWGSSALNPAIGQTSGKGLSLNNLYTQGVEFNVSYFL